ncbi:MAG: O-antigen ligase family protein [Acidobacteriota bacterium]|nr:MAG: O-antigen ligase family protein [Acidobacteriota bacterium]
MQAFAFRMGQWERPLTAARTILLPLVLGVFGVYVVAQIAVQRGWYSIFSLTAVLFLVGFAVKRLHVALMAIIIVNVLHSTFHFMQERWLVLAVGLLPFVWRAVSQYRGRMVLTRYHLAWIAFLVFIFTSSLYSENFLLTFAKSISVLLVFLAMAVMLYYHLKFNPKDFGTLMVMLAYSNVVVTVWSFLHVIGAAGAVGKTVLGNPNSLGAFLTLTLPYVVYQFYNSMNRPVRISWLVLVGMNFFFLLRTHSRASLLGVLVGVSLYWFARNRAGFAYFVGLLFLAFVMQITFSPAMRHSFLQTYIYKGSVTGDALRSRRSTWERQWDVFKKYPLTGVGFGLSEGCGKYWTFSLSSGAAMKESGSSLMMLMEGGGLPAAVLGYLPPLMLIYYGGQRYRRIILERSTLSEEEDRMCVLLAGCVGGFINCQFEGWLYAAGSMWSIFFWYQAALLLYVLTSMEEKELGLVPSQAVEGESPPPA